MAIKHRLVGIIVIIALAMIIIPVLMNHNQTESNTLQLSSKVPRPPAKPNITLAIPPESQTMPQALPLQRKAETEPTTEPTESKTQPAASPVTLQQPVQEKHAAAKKPVVAKKITPAPAKAWVIQLGTFSDKTNAANLVKKLKEKGFTAYMHESSKDNEKVTTVFVGPNIQRNMAEKTAQQLEKMFNLKGLVVRFTL